MYIIYYQTDKHNLLSLYMTTWYWITNWESLLSVFCSCLWFLSPHRNVREVTPVWLIITSAWIGSEQGWHQWTWEKFLGALTQDRNNFILLIQFENRVLFFFLHNFRNRTLTFFPRTLNFVWDSLCCNPDSFHSQPPQLCCRAGFTLHLFLKAWTLILHVLHFYFSFLLFVCSFNILTPSFCSLKGKAGLLLKLAHWTCRELPWALLIKTFCSRNLLRSLGFTAQIHQLYLGTHHI